MESYPHVHDLLVISMAIFAGCHWPHRKPRKKPGKAAPGSSLRSDKGSSKSWRSSDWDPGPGNPGQMPGRSTDHWWISPYFTIISNPGNPALDFSGIPSSGLLSGIRDDRILQAPRTGRVQTLLKSRKVAVEISTWFWWFQQLLCGISTATLRDSYFAILAVLMIIWRCSKKLLNHILHDVTMSVLCAEERHMGHCFLIFPGAWFDHQQEIWAHEFIGELQQNRGNGLSYDHHSCCVWVNSVVAITQQRQRYQHQLFGGSSQES